MNENEKGFGVKGVGQSDASGDEAEYGVDVGPDDGDAGEQLVQVVGRPEAVGQLLHLHETAHAAKDGQGQHGDLGPEEYPKHLVTELGGVLFPKRKILIQALFLCNICVVFRTVLAF